MKNDHFPLSFQFQGRKYEGYFQPMYQDVIRHQPLMYRVHLNTLNFGCLKKKDHKWSLDSSKPQDLVDMIGEQIQYWIP